jgi:hypothetical protein
MRKSFVIAAGLLVMGMTTFSSASWAGWGCAARNGNGAWGNSFGYSTRGQAGATALRLCKQRGCRVVACDADVNSSEQANGMWPPTSNATRCVGAGC